MSTFPHTPSAPAVEAPHPGSREMPRWNLAELPDAPLFTGRNWLAMLGPALLMGGAAIGGGEWLVGPTVTARYGGALMWLATLSILGQVVYNIEISRYALYTGEPIFTGKFRTLPGPQFWLFMYLILDFGSVFPYLAANAAIPAASVWLGHIPDSTNPDEKALMKWLGIAIFLLAFMPSIFGGKIYNSLKAIMGFKVVTVLTFLMILGLFYAKPSTWSEVFSGFVKIGNVPVQHPEDVNRNGILDPGEDWDGDGRLDIVEPLLNVPKLDTNGDGKPDAPDLNADGKPDGFVRIDTDGDGRPDTTWPDLDADGQPDTTMFLDFDGDGKPDTLVPVDADGDGKPDHWADKDGDGKPDAKFYDHDGDGIRDGDNIENVFVSLASGSGLPRVDLSMIAFLCAFAAIAGSGGLSNTPTSNYTRDQGWGMGYHVGAIPSLVGGHKIQLSHVGTVFQVTPEALPRWKRWLNHVRRDQLVVWMPACFLGIALPSMLSVEFLRRGTIADQWAAAGMTAGGVREAVTLKSGVWMGHAFWYMTLLCGFLVLAPTMASTAEGFIRRWVDVFWTSSRYLRSLDLAKIKYVYFSVLCGYLVFGLLMLTVVPRPDKLVTISTNIMNFALGFSCWHTLVINTTLLPREIRPGWFIRSMMFLAGFFFWMLASITALREFGFMS